MIFQGTGTRLIRCLGGVLSLLVCLMPFAQSPVWSQSEVQQFTQASLFFGNSRPFTPSDWTFEFVTAQEIPADGSLVLTPEPGEFTIPAGLDEGDIDLLLNAVDIPLAGAPGNGAGTAWGIAVTVGTSGSITLTNNDTDAVAAATAVEIRIGLHATYETTGDSQITSPAKNALTGTADIWEVDVTSYDSDGTTVIDTIDLLVATLEQVRNSVSSAAQMSFTVTGETAPADGEISPNYIRWNELTPGIAKTAVQRVKVNTSAQNGFTVYVRQNHNLELAADNAIDIDRFPGNNTIPLAWAQPAGTTIAVDTGYLGYTTSDTSLNTDGGELANRFTGGTLYAALTDIPEEILYHPVASQSNIDGQDYANITYQLEVNNLQPSGNYSNEIIYIAKPVF